ncbi:MAG TPA: hypothetical protein VE077_15575 [Candidatus Methylomirabilis sp.]|nr:hypothetical protein [Candidatus Methylomirabilis sp.]
MLGFSPQNLKLDGKYHHLKVTLKNSQRLALQAIFSREEMHEVPIKCQTQFFRSASGVRLSVVTHHRMPSGWINAVDYETFDPAELPESARRLARWLDTGKAASRFGIGVSMLSGSSPAHPKYSVLIATYESRWTSFWRIFWE